VVIALPEPFSQGDKHMAKTTPLSDAELEAQVNNKLVEILELCGAPHTLATEAAARDLTKGLTGMFRVLSSALKARGW
jgi:hypothetical protein